MSWRYLCRTSWRCREDVFKTSRQDVLKTSWRRLDNVFKISWRRLTDFLKMFLQNVLKTFLRHLEDIWSRQRYWSSSKLLSWKRLLKRDNQGASTRLAQDVLMTSWRRLLKTKTKVFIKTNVCCVPNCFLYKLMLFLIFNKFFW